MSPPVSRVLFAIDQQTENPQVNLYADDHGKTLFVLRLLGAMMSHMDCNDPRCWCRDTDTPYQHADPDEAARVGAAEAARWADTLRLLAESDADDAPR